MAQGTKPRIIFARPEPGGSRINQAAETSLPGYHHTEWCVAGGNGRASPANVML